MNVANAARVVCACVVVATLSSARPALAQNHFPLEITNIKPFGAAPNGLDADNRIYRAYPGVPYNIRAAVIGGAYLYSFALSNAPAGMTIDSRGEINWPNPTANATPTLIVSDALGAQVSATWTITVSSTGFRFVDAVNGRNAANNGCSSSCGSGTASNPWRTIRDAYLNATGGTITYFRNGTYNVLDIPRNGAGGVWERVEFDEYNRSVIWLEYPGAAAVIDFGYRGGTEFGPLIRFSGDNVYVDGFETRYSHLIAFQVAPSGGLRGATFRRLNMHHHGPGQDGTNASFIMTMSNYPNVSYGMVIQDNSFWNAQTCTVKLYSLNKVLLENNVHHTSTAGPELKADIRRFTVRGETMYNVETIGIGGNMHGIVGNPDTPTTNGEIAFNNVESDNFALDINQDSQALAIYSYRNTFRGRIRVRNTDSADGPFRFVNNVIVSGDSGTPAGSHIYLENVASPGRVIVGENLAGYPGDGLVDTSGNLTGSFAQYVGLHGHQIGPLGPRPPTNLRILP